MIRTVACRTYDFLIVIFFLIALAAPLIGSLCSEDRNFSPSEKRALAELPQFPGSLSGFGAYFQKFERYYADHFGFREMLIYRYQKEMKNRFRLTGTPLVLRGEKKWLFFTGDNLLADFQGEESLSQQQLQEFTDIQKKREQWLEQRGVRYLSFAPPNKQTIYPEHMPQMYRQSKGKSRLQQFHEYLSQSPLPLYVNVHDALLKAKPQGKLYFALDSHWNQFGAYVAFEELVKKMEEIFPGNSFSTNFPFHKHPQISVGGDLATILMVENIEAEIVPMTLPRKYCSRKIDLRLDLSALSDKVQEQLVVKGCKTAGLKGVVFGDSFIWQIERYLSENFSLIVYLQKGFDREVIQEVMKVFKPDIVIEERAERNYFKALQEKAN